MSARALLDTHALLRFITDDARLGARARAVIESPGARVWVSVASTWEIATKHSIGKLPLAAPFDETFPAQLNANAFEVLGVDLAHLSRLVALPFHHRDPFDRLIVAQAQAEGLPVLTRDRHIAQYDLEVVWS